MFGFLTEKFSDFFSRFTSGGSLTPAAVDSALEMVKNTLLQADVPYEVTERFITEVRADIVGKKITGSLKPSEWVMKIVYDRLVILLGGKSALKSFSFQIPSTSMLVGLQGAGKTTTLAKLAAFIQKENASRNKKRKILVCSVDYYRPAAREQLAVLARSLGIEYYQPTASEPVAAAAQAVEYARKNSFEYCFIDTAGRLHVDNELLGELKALVQRIKPTYTFLVLDSMIGQESLRVAQSFEAVAPSTGIILSKMDSDTRAGVAFACHSVVKKPVIFMGTGEKLDDLEYFNPERIAQRMVGLGDMQTLLEKAEEKIKKADQHEMQKALLQGKFTLQDFAKQLEMMSSLGSLSSIMKYMPGIPGLKVDAAQLEKGERELKKFKAIISSMTPRERIGRISLTDSRKKRIALGSGTRPADVALLLERFEQSQQFVKILKRTPHF